MLKIRVIKNKSRKSEVGSPESPERQRIRFKKPGLLFYNSCNWCLKFVLFKTKIRRRCKPSPDFGHLSPDLF